MALIRDFACRNDLKQNFSSFVSDGSNGNGIWKPQAQFFQTNLSNLEFICGETLLICILQSSPSAHK